MIFVKMGLVVLSIILIRKITWGYIARRMQYLLWIVGGLDYERNSNETNWLCTQ